MMAYLTILALFNKLMAAITKEAYCDSPGFFALCDIQVINHTHIGIKVIKI